MLQFLNGLGGVREQVGSHRSNILVVGDNHQNIYQLLSPWLPLDHASELSAREDQKKEAKWFNRKNILGFGSSSSVKSQTHAPRHMTVDERIQPTAETTKRQWRLLFYQDTWKDFITKCNGNGLRGDEYSAIVFSVDVLKGPEELSEFIQQFEPLRKAKLPTVPIIWVLMGLTASSTDKDKSMAFRIQTIIEEVPYPSEDILTFKGRTLKGQHGITWDDVLESITAKLDAGESQLKQKLTAFQQVSSGFGFRTSKRIQTDELKSSDYIIAVMGPTGAGKSSFINSLTGHNLNVGHTLESCTSDISIVMMTIPAVTDLRIVLVDTPGFDDTHKSDLDIFKLISEWLNKTYAKGTLLSGVLYFHRISDNRMAGTPLKNLRMFQSLCGKDAYDKITLVTTMWDDVDEKVGKEREDELKTKYWKAMIDGRKDQRAHIARFKNTTDSSLKILLKCLGDNGSRQRMLQLQEELGQMGRDLPETHAGKKMYSKLEALYERQQKVLEDLRKELKEEINDQMIIGMLKEEHQKAAQEMEALVLDMQQMKLTIPARFMSHLRSGLDLKWKRVA